MTATGQAIRLDVFGKHRKGNILQQHQIEAAAFDMFHFTAPLRASQRYEQEGNRKQQNRHLGKAAPGRNRSRKLRQHR